MLDNMAVFKNQNIKVLGTNIKIVLVFSISISKTCDWPRSSHSFSLYVLSVSLLQQWYSQPFVAILYSAATDINNINNNINNKGFFQWQTKAASHF